MLSRGVVFTVSPTLAIRTASLFLRFLLKAVIHQPAAFPHAFIYLDVLQIEISGPDLSRWRLILFCPLVFRAG